MAVGIGKQIRFFFIVFLSKTTIGEPWRNSLFRVHLVALSEQMYYYLVKQKGWSFNFSGSKQSFGRCENADCKQRGTKWSAEGSERVKETLPPYLIFSIKTWKIRKKKTDYREYQYGSRVCLRQAASACKSPLSRSPKLYFDQKSLSTPPFLRFPNAEFTIISRTSKKKNCSDFFTLLISFSPYVFLQFAPLGPPPLKLPGYHGSLIVVFYRKINLKSGRKIFRCRPPNDFRFLNSG